jgi:hypothetical protein
MSIFVSAIKAGAIGQRRYVCVRFQSSPHGTPMQSLHIQRAGETLFRDAA